MYWNARPRRMLTINSKWWWLGQTSYVWTCAVAKVSIAVALLRLTVARVHTLILWGVVAVTTVVGLIFWFILTLQCQPVAYFWQRVRLELDPTANVHGHCLNLDIVIAMAYVYSVTATCCDFILGILPIFLVWNLQMNVRTKAALAGILGMGCVASAAVIVRIPYLHDYKDPNFLCKFARQTPLLERNRLKTLCAHRCNHRHLHLVQRRSQPRYRRRQSGHAPSTFPLVQGSQLRRNSKQENRWQRASFKCERDSLRSLWSSVLAARSRPGRLPCRDYDHPYLESWQSNEQSGGSQPETDSRDIFSRRQRPEDLLRLGE